MKNFFPILSALIILSCNNQDSNANSNVADSIVGPVSKNEISGAGGCSNALLFKKGVVIEATTYDGNGKVLGLQSSEVLRVYKEKDELISEVNMKTTNAQGKEEKIIKAEYRCDGENFVMDMTFLRHVAPGSNVKTAGLFFPLNIKVGETLPEASHTVNIASGGKNMKIVSEIKNRKVEAKESITIPAGTFDAYRISAVIDATTEMDGMSGEMKKSMQDAKKRMGENRFIIWYTPELTVLKMEMYMGGKLQSKTEITRIQK